MRLLLASVLVAAALLVPAVGHAGGLRIGLTGHASTVFNFGNWGVAIFVSDDGSAGGHIIAGIGVRSSNGSGAISAPVVDAVPPGTGRPYWCASTASGDSEYPFNLFFFKDTGDGRTGFDKVALAASAANCADTTVAPGDDVFFDVISGDFKTIP